MSLKEFLIIIGAVTSISGFCLIIVSYSNPVIFKLMSMVGWVLFILGFILLVFAILSFFLIPKDKP